jgi:hypothetical protein
MARVIAWPYVIGGPAHGKKIDKSVRMEAFFSVSNDSNAFETSVYREEKFLINRETAVRVFMYGGILSTRDKNSAFVTELLEHAMKALGME